MDNQKNLLIAVVLSVVILVGFDFFFKPEKKQFQESSVEQTQMNQRVDSGEDDNLPSINSQIESTKVNKEDKLLEERITFNSKRLSGTINLIGATMDDLSLKDYFETINKENKIKILNPVSSVSPYFLRIGWASPDKSIKLPNKDSRWQSLKKSYSENEKIELEWNNGEGLTFFRTIEFDEDFLISVVDKVQNKSPKIIKLTNF